MVVTAADVMVWNGVDLDGLFQETVEKQTAGLGRTTVEAKGEFIEIVLEVGIADSAVVGPEPPSLQKRGDSVNSRHGHMGGQATCSQTLGTVLVSRTGEGNVPGPSVRVDDSALDHGSLDKRNEALRRSVLDTCHADTASTSTSNFGRDGYEDAICATSSDFLALTAQKGLIDLYGTAQPLSTWAHHGPTEFVQPRPGRFVAPEAQDSLQAKGANAVLLVGEIPDRLEPDPERFAGPLEERPRRARCLTLALGAANEPTLRFPSSQAPASRALESIWPSDPTQERIAGRLRREPLIEFL